MAVSGWGMLLPGLREPRGQKKSLPKSQKLRGQLLNCSLSEDIPTLEALSDSFSHASAPTRAGFEIAIADWWSRRNKKSFGEFVFGLVGSSKELPNTIRTNTLVQNQKLARAAVAQGQTTLKVKLGSPDAMEEFLSWAHTLPEAIYRIDANRAFSAPEILKLWPRLSDLKVDYFEDPLSSNDLDGWRQLAQSGIPLALDETESEVLFEEGTAKTRVLKLQFEQGLFKTAKQICQYREQGGNVTVTSALESSIGRAAAIYTAAALAPNWVHGLGAAEPVENWTKIVAGRIALPSAAIGLGIENEHYP